MKSPKRSQSTSDKDELLKIAKEFSKQRIVVLGDLMLDRYLWCGVERISPEAPIPIAKVENETAIPGGAANLVNNLHDLGTVVKAVGVIGNDAAGHNLTQLLEKKGINVSGIIVDQSRPTTLKTRIMSGHHHMLRLDYESTSQVNHQIEKELAYKVEEELEDADILVISDYSKGLITHGLAHKAITIAKRLNLCVLVDPTPKNIMKYKQTYMIKPNKREAEDIAGIKIDPNYSNLDRLGKRILRKLQTQVVMVTLGQDGIAVFDSKNGNYRIPCIDFRPAVDVSGAGDTTMAGLSASLSAGAPFNKAAMIGNICAGIAVSKPGTSTCSSQELEDYIIKFL